MRSEIEIDLGGSYTLNEHFVETLDRLLIEVIATIRTISENTSYLTLRKYFTSKEDVLESIRQARIQVLVAVDLLPKPLLDQGRSEEFYQRLNNCRKFLQTALENW